MAQADKKSHRERKNGRAHDLYLERNKARNAARPKQEFLPDYVADPAKPGSMMVQGGVWLR